MQSLDFDRILQRRRRNFEHLLALLREKVELVFHELPEGACPLAFPIAVNKKHEVVQRLVERGVEATTFWQNHANGVKPGVFPVVDRLRATVIELPCHQDLTPSDVDRVAEEVIRVLTTTY
jgi:dTDP-4-amino-4,6-dideoxygalactose transaminase